VRRRKEVIQGYLYLTPTVIILAAVVGWPLLEALRMSFSNLYLLRGFDVQSFVGLENYIRFLEDPNAPKYLKNTAIFVIGGTASQLTVGLTLALLLNERMVLRGLWRGLAILPWAMPITVTVMIWKWILDGQWGILNYMLVELGITTSYVSWLSSPIWLWPSILMVDAWAGFPFMFVTLLSALQGIPSELYDAARIDGAGRWTCFRRITLPMLRPVIATLLLLSVILHLRDFSTLWILTSGGPGIESTTLSPLVYITTFRYFRMGYGAAIGIILMAMSLIFTILYLRRTRFEID
jgi:multiple sugar transport system permease protein